MAANDRIGQGPVDPAIPRNYSSGTNSQRTGDPLRGVATPLLQGNAIAALSASSAATVAVATAAPPYLAPSSRSLQLCQLARAIRENPEDDYTIDRFDSAIQANICDNLQRIPKRSVDWEGVQKALAVELTITPSLILQDMLHYPAERETLMTLLPPRWQQALSDKMPFGIGWTAVPWQQTEAIRATLTEVDGIQQQLEGVFREAQQEFDRIIRSYSGDDAQRAPKVAHLNTLARRLVEILAPGVPFQQWTHPQGQSYPNLFTVIVTDYLNRYPCLRMVPYLLIFSPGANKTASLPFPSLSFARLSPQAVFAPVTAVVAPPVSNPQTAFAPSVSAPVGGAAAGSVVPQQTASARVAVPQSASSSHSQWGPQIRHYPGFAHALPSGALVGIRMYRSNSLRLLQYAKALRSHTIPFPYAPGRVDVQKRADAWLQTLESNPEATWENIADYPEVQALAMELTVTPQLVLEDMRDFPGELEILFLLLPESLQDLMAANITPQSLLFLQTEGENSPLYRTINFLLSAGVGGNERERQEFCEQLQRGNAPFLMRSMQPQGPQWARTRDRIHFFHRQANELVSMLSGHYSWEEMAPFSLEYYQRAHPGQLPTDEEVIDYYMTRYPMLRQSPYLLLCSAPANRQTRPLEILGDPSFQTLNFRTLNRRVADAATAVLRPSIPMASMSSAPMPIQSGVPPFRRFDFEMSRPQEDDDEEEVEVVTPEKTPPQFPLPSEREIRERVQAAHQRLKELGQIDLSTLEKVDQRFAIHDSVCSFDLDAVLDRYVPNSPLTLEQFFEFFPWAEISEKHQEAFRRQISLRERTDPRSIPYLKKILHYFLIKTKGLVPGSLQEQALKTLFQRAVFVINDMQGGCAEQSVSQLQQFLVDIAVHDMTSQQDSQDPKFSLKCQLGAALCKRRITMVGSLVHQALDRFYPRRGDQVAGYLHEANLHVEVVKTLAPVLGLNGKIFLEGNVLEHQAIGRPSCFDQVCNEVQKTFLANYNIWRCLCEEARSAREDWSGSFTVPRTQMIQWILYHYGFKNEDFKQRIQDPALRQSMNELLLKFSQVDAGMDDPPLLDEGADFSDLGFLFFLETFGVMRQHGK